MVETRCAEALGLMVQVKDISLYNFPNYQDCHVMPLLIPVNPWKHSRSRSLCAEATMRAAPRQDRCINSRCCLRPQGLFVIPTLSSAPRKAYCSILSSRRRSREYAATVLFIIDRFLPLRTCQARLCLRSWRSTALDSVSRRVGQAAAGPVYFNCNSCL